jgi:hypothetical protein
MFQSARLATVIALGLNHEQRYAMRRLLLALILVPAFAAAAEPSPATKQEIDHLMTYLKGSGCQFNRNGSWYGPTEAVDHLNQKYRYLVGKDLVSSAEDFIARAASESSFSGKPYLVKCGASAPEQSGVWLRAELAKYRAARH